MTASPPPAPPVNTGTALRALRPSVIVSQRTVRTDELRVPNVLIAGVTHAGAADLAAVLTRHREIKGPVAKRIDHFTPMRYGRPVEAPVCDYDRHFANWSGQRYRLESSPVYFDGGGALVNAVARDLAGVRVLILLRDPAERLWTSFQDKVARGRLPRAMAYETFVERCLALRANGADRFEGNRYFRTMSSGFYVEHLTGWLDTFGRRVRVVFAEDLERDAETNLLALHDWLGLEPHSEPAPRIDPDGPDGGLETFEAAAGRRLWQLAPGVALVRRVTRSRVPRQSDRARNRVETLYAGANRELAAVLRDRGYTTLPQWLASA
jgi:hypothetical protein